MKFSLSLATDAFFQQSERDQNASVGSKCKKHTGNYLPYTDLLELAGVKGAPTYLKIDAEGFEWNIFPPIMEAGTQLPEQIGFEIHYHNLAGPSLGWTHNYKTQAEIVILGEIMFQAGYLPIHRRDNMWGVRGEATEYLMARVMR